MLTSFTNLNLSGSFKNNSLSLQITFLVILLIIADHFFYSETLGLSVPVFVLLTSCFAMATCHFRLKHLKDIYPMTLLVFAILPGIETTNYLTLSIALTGLIFFIVMINNKDVRSLDDWFSTLLSFLDNAPLQLFRDTKTFTKKVSQYSYDEKKIESFLTSLILPFLFSIGFIVLFVIANPLIYNWFSELEFKSAFSIDSFYRPLFWLVFAIALWPLLRYSKKALFRKTTLKSSKLDPTFIETSGFLQVYLTPASVTFSLIAFNIIFAIQTYLDLFYLWGNSQLPEGMTYASYAHKGAYTLIITVVLAAVFILFVMNKNRENNLSLFTKSLILFWTLQNVILVISTLMRMHLYIGAFALTYLRLFVLIWMLLVLIGLGLILFRIVFQRTNIWLIKTNLISLLTVLYVISFMNFPHIISTYNVDYAIKNPEEYIDVDYLITLGENALPAIVRVSPIYEARISPHLFKNHIINVRNRRLKNSIARFTKALVNSQTNWNSWSFRRYRLVNHLKSMRKKAE